MCQAYPARRDELDCYEAIIQDIEALHGGKFYEYHKLFSMRSATALEVHQLKLDWSKRDSELYSMISVHQSRACTKCGEFSHEAQFCPTPAQSRDRHPQSVLSGQQTLDRFGRRREYAGDFEICNNFNGQQGCRAPKCPRAHQCIRCRRKDHGASSCQNSSSQSYATGQKLKSPPKSGQ